MTNASYFHAAYVVAGLAYAAYALSLWWRGRALDRRQAALRAPRRAPTPPRGSGA